MKTLLCLAVTFLALVVVVGYSLIAHYADVVEGTWDDCTCVTIYGEPCKNMNIKGCEGYALEVMIEDKIVVVAWAFVVFTAVVVPLLCLLNCCSGSSFTPETKCGVNSMRVALFLLVVGTACSGYFLGHQGMNDLSMSLKAAFDKTDQWFDDTQVVIQTAANLTFNMDQEMVTPLMKFVVLISPDMKPTLEESASEAIDGLRDVQRKYVTTLRRTYEHWESVVEQYAEYVFYGVCGVMLLVFLSSLCSKRGVHFFALNILWLVTLALSSATLLVAMSAQVVHDTCDNYDSLKTKGMEMFVAHVGNSIGCVTTGSAERHGVGLLETVSKHWKDTVAAAYCPTICETQDACADFYSVFDNCTFDNMEALLGYPPKDYKTMDAWPMIVTTLTKDLPKLKEFITDTLDPLGRCTAVADLMTNEESPLCTEDPSVRHSVWGITVSLEICILCAALALLILFAGSFAFAYPPIPFDDPVYDLLEAEEADSSVQARRARAKARRQKQKEAATETRNCTARDEEAPLLAAPPAATAPSASPSFYGTTSGTYPEAPTYSPPQNPSPASPHTPVNVASPAMRSAHSTVYEGNALFTLPQHSDDVRAGTCVESPIFGEIVAPPRICTASSTSDEDVAVAADVARAASVDEAASSASDEDVAVAADVARAASVEGDEY